MNRISDLKHLKSKSYSNKPKSTISTISLSASTKFSTKARLSDIFEYMSSEYSLSDLAETLEKETGGKFTQLTFREIIDRIYPDLSINDKIFLIKHLPLSKVGITPYSPLIFILYLFKYIESITKEKIISPSLIFYDLAETIQYRHGISTLEFFHSLNLEPEQEITIEDFYLHLGSRMGLDEISEIVLFKSLDYNKKSKIKIEDLILVIDSYRKDNLEEKNILMDNTAKKNVNLLKIFLEKNMINLDLIYENAEYNYMRFNDLKSFLVNEIYNYRRFTNGEDMQINESIVDSVLSVIKRDDKIFKNDFKNYLGDFSLGINKDEKEDNNNDINVIELNYKQKYWINKYLDLINSIKSTPRLIFNSSLKDQNSKVSNIVDILKQLVRLLPSGKLSTNEMTNIMNSLDINNTGLIEFNQYEIIINQIIDIKNTIKSKVESQESISINSKLDGAYDQKSFNIWTKGVKSAYYHLLPAKGNYELLEQINQDIKNNLLYDDNKENDKNTNNVFQKIKKMKKKKESKNFSEEENPRGDEGVVYEEINKETGEVQKYYTNDKDMATDKVEVFNDYSEEDSVRMALENFYCEKIYFSNEDLFAHLKRNKIEEKTCEDLVKYIDNNDDGLISLVDLFKFLLYELKYKSVKLVLKYLYIKIYKELELKSSYSFFKKNKFNVQKNININKLCKFFESVFIDTPLTKKIYDILQYIFKPPILYIHLCQLIDDCEDNSLKIERKKMNENKENNNNNDDKTDNNDLIISFNVDNLDDEMKNVIRNLIDIEDYKGKDSLRCKNLNDKISDMLNDCPEKMNYNQFIDKFCKKLNISSASYNAIFHILKQTSLKTKQQLISKNDLLMFLQIYCYETDKSNFINGFNKKEDEDDEGLSLSTIKNIVTNIEQNGPVLKYSFEKIPFRCNGLISCAEIIKIIDNFYNSSIPKKELMYIVSCIDEDKKGYVTYPQLQLFLNNYSSDDNNFSALLEIQIIACNIYSQNFTKLEKYFKKIKKVKNFEEMSKKQHNSLLSKLCSNKNNKAKLFKYFTDITKNNFYDLKLLTNKINCLLEIDNNKINEIKEEDKDMDSEEENLGLPDKTTFENALKLINLGHNGFVSMNELLLKLKKGYRKSLSKKIDKKQEGYISFPNFIKICRKIYGTEINLNYKLCAQYLYKVFIKSPNQVKNFILKKACQTNINTYLDKSDVYNNFMFVFCNDKFLFETFYLIYNEKKGKYKNKLNLNSFLLFIYSNNLELKSLETDLRFNKTNNNNKEQIDSRDKKKIIIDILDKKLTNIREIIENINYNSSKLQKNFSISEKYFNTLLQTHFNFNDDESEELCNYFRQEEGKFDLKKFYEFDPNNDKNHNIILADDILPKIQNHISKSVYKSYKEYKNKNFKSDYLDICELYIIFNKLYNITLFQCLLIINWYKEQYLSIEAFFKDNNLKNYFPSKDFDPTLKLAIVRLNEYIEENYKDKKQDKLKIFKGYDTNKDGILSSEEFITALNSLKGLNLNDSQKYKLYNFADTNRDGKINAKEFLDLIKSIKNYINEEGELNAPLPASNIPSIDNQKYIPKILKKEISIIKQNYKHNKTKITNLDKNTFLSCVVKLQGDLITNYFNEECMENDFVTADKKNDGYINENTFKIILQKRLFSADDEIYNLFIKFTEDEEEIDNDEEKRSNENDKNKSRKINYKIFLNKLASYKIKDNKTGKKKTTLPKIK